MRDQQSMLVCDTGMVVTSLSAFAHPVEGAWKYKLFMEQTKYSLEQITLCCVGFFFFFFNYYLLLFIIINILHWNSSLFKQFLQF